MVKEVSNAEEIERDSSCALLDDANLGVKKISLGRLAAGQIPEECKKVGVECLSESVEISQTGSSEWQANPALVQAAAINEIRGFYGRARLCGAGEAPGPDCVQVRAEFAMGDEVGAPHQSVSLAAETSVRLFRVPSPFGGGDWIEGVPVRVVSTRERQMEAAMVR